MWIQIQQDNTQKYTALLTNNLTYYKFIWSIQWPARFFEAQFYENYGI